MITSSEPAFAPPLMGVSPATAARRAALHLPVSRVLRDGYTSVTGVDEAVSFSF